MRSAYFERSGGISLIIGSFLFAAYASLLPVLLPIGNGTYDLAQVVLTPGWVPLSIDALVGILLMLFGFYIVYSRIQSKAGLLGATGFLFIEIAYLLQACKVTWELFLYPIIAIHAESAFLLRDGILKHDPSVIVFRTISSITIFVGVVMFCLALHRSNEYPKAAPLLIFIGAVTYAVGPVISVFASIAGIFILAIGCSFLGATLMKPVRA